MDIFELMKKNGHEQIIFNFDNGTGMKAIIAIHDSMLGQTFGGVRMKTERIYDRLLHIFEMAKKEGILPLKAANRYAESRIREIHKLNRLYVPK